GERIIRIRVAARHRTVAGIQGTSVRGELSRRAYPALLRLGEQLVCIRILLSDIISAKRGRDSRRRQLLRLCLERVARRLRADIQGDANAATDQYQEYCCDAAADDPAAFRAFLLLLWVLR